MTRQAERIIKELSPKFPDWKRDFRDFLEWQHYGLIGSDTDIYGMWESMENLYATLMASMIRRSGIKDQWEGPEFLPLAVKAWTFGNTEAGRNPGKGRSHGSTESQKPDLSSYQECCCLGKK